MRRKIIAFDLLAEAKAMKYEKAWNEHGHDAKTLAHREHVRSLLLVLKNGKRIPRHSMPGDVTLQGLDGRIRIHLPDEIVELGAGSLLSIDHDIPFDIEAKTGDCVVLVTFGTCNCAEE
ncbi:MAG TPA: hypothetical protein VMV18_15700 [bacterium]|nr:hypothetical protein [bacterium]